MLLFVFQLKVRAYNDLALKFIVLAIILFFFYFNPVLTKVTATEIWEHWDCDFKETCTL